MTPRELKRYLGRESKKWPAALIEIPSDQWPIWTAPALKPLRVLRSRQFLVQVHEAPPPALARMSVNRAVGNGVQWEAGVTWDELQRLKGECGYAEMWAVEIFPAQSEVVNVANMRHLWILPDAPAYGRRASRRAALSDDHADSVNLMDLP